MILAWMFPLRNAYPDHLYGLDPQKSITQYTHRVWQAEDGLPQNSVNAILQDSRGYIWLGTQEGLVRFDGIKFFVFDKKHLTEMTSNYIWTIAEGPDSSLWFGTQGGGLYRNKNNRCSAFTTNDGLPSNHVTTLQFDHSGRLWIGTTRGLAMYADSTFQVFTTNDGLANNEVSTLLTDSEGALWIGTNGGGLSRLRQGTFERFTMKEGLFDHTVLSVLELSDGSVLVGTNGGVNLIRNGVVSPYRSGNREVKAVALSMLQDSLGAVWIGTTGSGLLRIRNGGQERFGVEEGLSDGFVRSLLQDREGNLWMGTYGGGVNFLTDGKFTRFTRAEGLSNDFTLSVSEDARGALWIGTYGGGLNRLKDGKVVSVTTSHGLPMNVISSVLPDRTGPMWVGSYGAGLSRMEAGKITTFTVRHGLSNNFITALLQDANGILWVGTRNGLNVRAGETFRALKLTDGSNQPTVIAIRESRDGGLWIGTEGKGLARYREGTVSFFTTEQGLPADYVTALFEDEHGALWIGTDGGGLVRYAGGRFSVIDSKGGLFDDVVFSILEDDFGFLWMSCNKGVFRVSKEELNAFANGTISRVRSIAYNRYDGMPSSECTGRRQPAAWKAANGFLWFPTIKGVVSIDPAQIKVNQQAPFVVVEAVISGVNTMLPGPSIILPPGIDRLEIRYTAPSFSAPEQVQFQYKLEGLEQEWMEVGSRRTAFYTNIPSGEYVFRVRAGNHDGVWNESSASVALTIQPYFYQSQYFYASCALLLAVVGYVTYYSRTHRHKHREEELVKIVAERTKDLNLEIIERNKAEEALRRSEQRLRDIVEHSTNLFYVHDINHVLSYVSPQTREFFDCEPEEALTRWTEFLTDNPTNRVGLEYTQRAIDTGKRQPNYELELIGKTGRKILVEVHEAPVVRNGATIAIVGALTDITGRKQLEEQLREASKLQSIGILAGGIAHNFNNILGIILAYASMLRRERENRVRYQEGIEAIQKTVERGAALVRQLLTFARKTDVMLETVDVNATIQELATMISETFPKTVSFALLLAEDLPSVRIDHNQLHQALLNLCVNARDAMFGEGNLTIRTRLTQSSHLARRFPKAAEGEYVAIEISDTGVGIDESIKHKIFEPFFTTKEVGKGTGLGLSVVYGIIESQKGFIDVQTLVGKGTTFAIYLPAVSQGEYTALQPEQRPEAQGGTERILVVEDEKMLIDLLRSMLESKGYGVLTAEDGARALSIFKEYHRTIHLVLMDIGLPHMSGWETLKNMKQINPGVPVVLASGYLETEAHERSLQEGARAFIAKPYVPETVHSIVRAVLDETRLSRPSR